MKTSEQWWNEVKQSEHLLHDWLIKQYRGEVTAAKRIRDIVEKFNPNSKHRRILLEIADQEATHARWVLTLLTNRGIQEPSVEGAEDRYWKETLPAAIDLQTAAGVGAHAEVMRLQRINAIVADKTAPNDIRVVFAMIQKQEMWHASAFARIAGEDALAATKNSHELGRQLLGLEA
jgi:rubrerythrin